MRFDGYSQSKMAEDNTIAEGTYQLRINKMTYNEPKGCSPLGPDDRGIPMFRDEKGNDKYPYLSADLVVQDEGEYLGRHVFDNYISLAPQDDWKIRSMMAAAGFDSDDALDTDALVERDVIGVVTKQKEGKGKDGKWYAARNGVGRYMSMDDVELRKVGSAPKR